MPSCPPGCLPVLRRKLRVRGSWRLNPSEEGGLPLLWLSLASRAWRSLISASAAANCSRSVAFSAFKATISSSDIMPLCYTCSASPAEQSPDIIDRDGIKLVLGEAVRAQLPRMQLLWLDAGYNGVAKGRTGSSRPRAGVSRRSKASTGVNTTGSPRTSHPTRSTGACTAPALASTSCPGAGWSSGPSRGWRIIAG